MKTMILPTDPKERKAIPFVTGLIDYFPLALAEVAKTSYVGQQQHNPDKPLAWDKEKSKDHADCIGRHLVDRGTFDTDGVRHSAKLAWRALANLQNELEEASSCLTKDEGEYSPDGWKNVSKIVYHGYLPENIGTSIYYRTIESCIKGTGDMTGFVESVDWELPVGHKNKVIAYKLAK